MTRQDYDEGMRQLVNRWLFSNNLNLLRVYATVSDTDPLPSRYALASAVNPILEGWQLCTGWDTAEPGITPQSWVCSTAAMAWSNPGPGPVTVRSFFTAIAVIGSATRYLLVGSLLPAPETLPAGGVHNPVITLGLYGPPSPP